MDLEFGPLPFCGGWAIEIGKVKNSMSPSTVFKIARLLLWIVVLLSLWMLYGFITVFITIGIYLEGPYSVWRLLEPLSYLTVGVWALLWLRES